MIIDRLDINPLNVLLVLPHEIRLSLVYVAPVPVFLGDREIGSAVYVSDPSKSFIRIKFNEPGEYEGLAYRYPACVAESVPEPTGQTSYAMTKIVYASVQREYIRSDYS